MSIVQWRKWDWKTHLENEINKSQSGKKGTKKVDCVFPLQFPPFSYLCALVCFFPKLNRQSRHCQHAITPFFFFQRQITMSKMPIMKMSRMMVLLWCWRWFLLVYSWSKNPQIQQLWILTVAPIAPPNFWHVLHVAHYRDPIPLGTRLPTKL